LLYKLLLYPARIAVHFYCRKIVINHSDLLMERGPMILAANHPNSFLDAIILASIFKSPIYSLARGDAFAGKLVTKILQSFNMMPVYRVSEGVGNLEHNYTTFHACQELFEKNKIVLIFSEGRCINEWHLRPLKKGTARLALTAWHHDIPLKVLPLGINYNSFRKFGKVIHLNFGKTINKTDIHQDHFQGKAINEFNAKLKSQLEGLVYEIDKNDKRKLAEYFKVTPSPAKKIALSIPAFIGCILNAPLYFLIHLIIKNRANDHYDSVMTGLLFLFYPLYVVFISLSVFFISGSAIALLLLLAFPLTALSLLHFRNY
jgi:1-acyl-sn-glycerol-3-phosphate acyltransferase